MKFHLAICAALVFIASNTNSASAQNTIATQETTTEAPQWRALPLKNGDPGEVGWALDPLHNRSLADMDFASMQSAWRNPPALPDGVQSVIGVKPLASLLVLSTAKGLQELQNLVDPLDQPVREIDVRVTLVTIDALTLASLQLDPQSEGADAKQEPNYTKLEVPDTKLAKLNALIAQGKVKESPLNNYPLISRYKNNKRTGLIVTKTLPENESSVSEALRKSIRESHIAGDPEISFYRGTSFLMKPVINEDGTISLELLVAKSMGLVSPNAPKLGTDQTLRETLALQTRDKFEGTVKMKNGSTVALLRSNVYAPTTEKEATDSTEFLLLTARIARPGDDIILYTR